METTTQQFFDSVARAFGENGPRGPGAVGVLILTGVVAGLLLAGAIRRALARRAAFSAFTAARGLSPADLSLLGALARDAGEALPDLLTHLDLFERVSARALAAVPPDAPGDPAADLGRIRHLLGFDRLAAHVPLLTTRELAAGTAVELEGEARGRGAVTAVDERRLVVEVDEEAARPEGVEVALAVAHAREARYAARCRVLAVRRGLLGVVQLALAHDEAPRRLQRRDHVRVLTEGTILLRPRLWAVPAPAPAAPVAVPARLVDVSAGGLRVEAAALLPVGLVVELDLTVAGERFEGLRAVVLSSARLADGKRDVHLELTRLGEREAHLTAAVARLEAARR